MSHNSRCKACGKTSDKSICQKCFIPFNSSSDDRVSFAFAMKVPDFSKLKNVEVLDLFRTSIASLNMSDFPRIKKIRAARCLNLNRVNLQKMPNLEVIDFSANKELIQITADKLPNLVAFDVSFCEKLISIPNIKYPALNFLSTRHTKISELPDTPNILFLDISSTNIENIENIQNYDKLEIFIFDRMKFTSFNICQLSNLPNLNVIQSDVENVLNNSSEFQWNPNTKLTQIWLNNSKTVEEFPIDNEKMSVMLPNEDLRGLKFKSPHEAGEWHYAARKVYGPWPLPPCYQRKPRISRSKFAIPSNFDHHRAVISILGSIFGATVADTISLFVERQKPEVINFMLEGTIDSTWSHPRITRRAVELPRGGITDNTAMMLMIMRSLTGRDGKFLETDLAKRIKEYVNEGMTENQLHIIGHSASVTKIVRDPQFSSDPSAAAKKYWMQSGETPSGNDALTRSVVPGCFQFWDDKSVCENSEIVCKTTHFDPRCRFAAVCISLMVARFIQIRSSTKKDEKKCISELFDVDQCINDAISAVKDLTPYMIQEIRKFTDVDDLNRLGLCNFTPLVLQALGCAVWALKSGLQYKDGVEAILRAGGDAATNAAVVGAVLGAKWGLSAIPIDLMWYFWCGAPVEYDTKTFLKLMDIDFQMPTYEEYFTMNFGDLL
ncbi:hypothetical protein TRFO_01614 [Tritrichomonas foetus]|uniref:ADP-ribosylhydrolase ARH3 n=1 Tax=Tritrichomonas foetus TaxID=1144522 RepID=A0A1J4JPJ5_9EUKA|nr:hypothetical protein TRFO_01614 [Tritrichomonas foetus]|eukprot:OHT01057.1 hypothetical protein TRFO_01614 [Tritrichomonas foetus]